MFDIGMTELLVVAVIAIIVVGPKDLPGLLRTLAKQLGQLRSLARDFQGQMNEALRESELDSVKTSLDDVKNLNPVSNIKKQVTDFVDDTTNFDKIDFEESDLDQADASYIKEGDRLAQTDMRPEKTETNNDKSVGQNKPVESTSS